MDHIFLLSGIGSKNSDLEALGLAPFTYTHKTMKELLCTSVLGIQERLNLAQNFVTPSHG